ncbi:hypothetical protein E4U52_001011 [Claviceps spartinae]|nr:hypothetical protein E4U52_001011 [Claviceps spartinae]
MIKFEEYRSKKPVETTRKILSPLEIPKAIFLYDAQRGKAKGLKDQWKHNYIKNMTDLGVVILLTELKARDIPIVTALRLPRMLLKSTGTCTANAKSSSAAVTMGMLRALSSMGQNDDAGILPEE